MNYIVSVLAAVYMPQVNIYLHQVDKSSLVKSCK